jgi:4-amino-4-deoxy-L-arabinose transferase-like glycosyltransferase
MQTHRVPHPDFVPLAAATFLVTLAFALGMGNHGPIPSMETRFAVAVQQMLAHHAWLVPEKNGLPYIEYPPFYYWLAMLAAKAGLPLLPAIRLPNLLALWVWLAAVYGLGRRLVPALPRWLLPVAAVAAPAVLYNFFIAQSDGWLAAGIALAVLGYAKLAETRGFPWLLWSGASLAVFAKGPVGLVVPVLVIAVDIVLAAAFKAERWATLPRTVARLAPIRGIALAVAPLAAWYVACGFFVGWDFVRGALVYDNFTRYVAGAGGHHNPWWLFAQSIWGDYFPWSLALPFGIVLAARRLREPGLRLAFAWAATTLVFFSLSASKQSKYILPAAPALVALALLALAAAARRRPPWLVRSAAAWSALVLLAFVVTVGVWLPFAGPGIDDDAAYARFKGIVRAEPGRLFMYRWPRSLILYQLGAPMPWFADARAVYAALHDGRLKPGDYLLVPSSDLAHADAHGALALEPVPAPPYFEHVTTLASKGGIEIYRVLPSAVSAPVPVTAVPPPTPWWAEFDTD